MIDLFDGIDYVKSWLLSKELSSVYWYDISTGTAENVVLLSNEKFYSMKPYVTLVTDDFTLRYDGSSLTLTNVLGDDNYDKLDDPNISEEWFFQLSTIKNYGTLQYEEIEFVKELYNRKHIMGI